MQITAFKVENYRGILDSNWIDVNDITAIVGKNESGKTSLLRALSKFNSPSGEKFDLIKEWPRSPRHTAKKTGETDVVRVRFQFNQNERQTIEEFDEFFKGIEGIEISCDYNNEYSYRFFPEKVYERRESHLIALAVDRFTAFEPTSMSIVFKNRFDSGFGPLLKKLSKQNHTVDAARLVRDFRNMLPSYVSEKEEDKEIDATELPIILTAIDQFATTLEEDGMYIKLLDIVDTWLPIFIYMDDYKIFSGTAQLNEIKARKDSGTLTPEDQTFLTILNLSGLDLDQEVARGSEINKQQRAIDTRRAALQLTEQIAKRWTQKEYDVEFELDGQHFMTFVTDKMNVRIDEKTQSKESSKTPVALEERSKGFQWFFSFDVNFMYETNGEFKNAILLLDEPGLHLHAAAQNDLLNRFREYAKNNQIIYTTHLPFMIDSQRFDNIVIAEETDAGLKFHKDWATANEDARYTLQAALGMSWSQFLFINQYNLVVEGFTDYIYLSTLSSLLNTANSSGLDPDLTLTIAGGGTRAAHLASMLNGQKLNVAVLLDSDTEGENARDQLVKDWIMKNEQVILLGTIFGANHPYSIEDLFPHDYYMLFVNQLFANELKKKPLSLGSGNSSIVELVKRALEDRGVTKTFNKGSVAKMITNDLMQKSITEIPQEIVTNFSTLFDVLNKIMHKWKKKTQSTK
jgi:predicted ATP-dependent endonuclease of OLD family